MEYVARGELSRDDLSRVVDAVRRSTGHQGKLEEALGSMGWQPMPEFVTDFVQLEVYQEAGEVSRRIFDASKSFLPEERYCLVDQLRRASSSIGAQIAEAWGKRQCPRHFRRRNH